MGRLSSHSNTMFFSACNTFGVNVEVPLPFLNTIRSCSPAMVFPYAEIVNGFHAG